MANDQMREEGGASASTSSSSGALAPGLPTCLPGLTDCSVDTAQRMQVPESTAMCIPLALADMEIVTGGPSQSALCSGPYTYRQMADYYHVSFTNIAYEHLLCPNVEHTYVLHVEGARRGRPLHWTHARR